MASLGCLSLSVTDTLGGVVTDDAGCWVVEFYDFTATAGQLDGDLAQLGDVHERARRNGARQGTPVIVHTAGEVDARVNLFFRTGPMAAARPGTWRRYAFALVVWLNFLQVWGRPWDRAGRGDVEAFKDWRLTDARNDGRVAPASFDTDRAALNSFYGWASSRYRITNPVPSAPRRAWRQADEGDAALRDLPGRDGLRPASASRRQVKWMLRPAFEQWRDVGLRGYGLDGLRRPGWRGGGCEDRDIAFVDGLYGTGLRLTEWASVLDVELPRADGARFARAYLAAACAKGGHHGRVYRIPRAVLAAVEAYLDPVEGSRRLAISRAQRAGRYDGLPGARIVTGYNAQARVLHLAPQAGEGGARAVRADALGPGERRLLFRKAPAGLEPLAVWLTPAGMPKTPHGWEDTFQAANARIRGAWAAAGGRPWEAPLFCRPHMCRHSFALKWFSILSLAWDRRLEGFTADEAAELRDMFGDVWFQLATLMGHADPATTRDVYLEPFTSLRLDYLMSLLDEDERAGVDALVRAVAADTGRVLAGLPALADGSDLAKAGRR